jgi:hypothetical protein
MLEHPYLAFPEVPNANPWLQQYTQACTWGGGTNDSQTTFGREFGSVVEQAGHFG